MYIVKKQCLVYAFCERSTGVCFFFFFQAEDGIRDLTVTGVQTCALPICSRGGRRNGGQESGEGREREKGNLSPSGEGREKILRKVQNKAGGDTGKCTDRSEERRGGKECRSRWSPYH